MLCNLSLSGVCLYIRSAGVCLYIRSAGVCLYIRTAGVCLYIRSAGVCLYIHSAGVYLAGLIYEIQYATFSFNQVDTGLVVMETDNRPINSFLDVLFLFQLENMLHTLENTGHVSNGEISTCG